MSSKTVELSDQLLRNIAIFSIGHDTRLSEHNASGVHPELVRFRVEAFTTQKTINVVAWVEGKTTTRSFFSSRRRHERPPLCRRTRACYRPAEARARIRSSAARLLTAPALEQLGYTARRGWTR